MILISRLLALTLLSTMSFQVSTSSLHDQIKQEVLKTEMQRIQALKTNEIATLEFILADDLTYTHSNGSVQSKGQFLALLRSGEVRYEKMEHKELYVRIYDSAAVLNGLSNVTVKNKGQNIDLLLRFTMVYVKRDNHWKMVAWQSTQPTTP